MKNCVFYFEATMKYKMYLCKVHNSKLILAIYFQWEKIGFTWFKSLSFLGIKIGRSREKNHHSWRNCQFNGCWFPEVIRRLRMEYLSLSGISVCYSRARLIRTQNMRKICANYSSMWSIRAYFTLCFCQWWRVVYRIVMRIIQKVRITKGQIIRAGLY